MEELCRNRTTKQVTLLTYAETVSSSAKKQVSALMVSARIRSECRREGRQQRDTNLRRKEIGIRQRHHVPKENVSRRSSTVVIRSSNWSYSKWLLGHRSGGQKRSSSSGMSLKRMWRYLLKPVRDFP